MKNNGVQSLVGRIIVGFLLLWPKAIWGHDEVLFKNENFSRIANKLMNDHQKNAVYHVGLLGVKEHLPTEHEIKLKFIKKVDSGVIPIKRVIKWYRRWLLRKSPFVRKCESSREFFSMFKEGVPYTYVILDDEFIFTESARNPLKEKFKNRFSKHYTLSGLKRYVRFSGEFFIYFNKHNHDIFVVFDNASGTYRPPANLLPNVQKLLQYNFQRKASRLYFITKSFDQKIDVERLFAYDDEAIN